MSIKEREQSKIFESLKLKQISQSEAAVRLKVSSRWVRKKLRRYIDKGDLGLIHQGRGRISNRRWRQKEKELAIDLLRNDWHGFGPKFTAEKLKEHHDITVSKETMRQAMISAGVWHGKKTHVKHRKQRERKSMLGMMIQADGSPHDWFEGRAAKCTLLVFIDDATSKILWLEFADGESVIALMQATKNYLKAHGIPQSFYVDHGSVFRVNLNNKEGVKKTQWEHAVGQLGIKVSHAKSPQAKGRVERCNKTLQDRLIKDMRLTKISSIQEANNYLRMGRYIETHNTLFSEQPAQKGNAHRSIDSYDLDSILCIKEKRVLANDFTITYRKQIFQLHEHQQAFIRPKNEITVSTLLDGSIRLSVRKIGLNFNIIKNRPQPIQEEKLKCYKPRIVSENSRLWASGKLPQSRMKSALPAAEAIV